MVILVASDQNALRRALTARLREATAHRVITASSPAEMRTVPAAESALDLLLFTPGFQEGEGRAARADLRTRFPGLQAVAIQDGEAEALAAQVLDLIQQMELPVPVAAPVSPVFGTVIPLPAGAAEPVGSEPEILGDYELSSLIRTTQTTEIYRAVQNAVNRQVALERLKPEYCQDEEAARQFRRTIRARAHVTHPHIAAVYEAQEYDGMVYYTRELIRAQNLTELQQAGKRLPQAVLLRILQVAAESFVWMREHDIAHESVNPIHLFLGPDGVPRIANTAVADENTASSEAADISGIAGALVPLMDGRAGQTREISHVLGLMKATGSHAANTWAAVSREARQALERVADGGTSALGLGPGGKSAGNQKLLLLGGVALLALAAAGWGASTWWQRRQRAEVRDHSAMVPIPAGEFIYGESERRTLPEFWIDKYEVTLAQYGGFLDALPHGDPKRFDHPEQPARKSGHTPPEWSALMAAAADAGTWNGQPITLNAPVFNVDWWDAWAYATWKVRRLPTDDEWIRAGRGSAGRLYPWGAQPDPTRANTGADYQAPVAAGQGDGYVFWSDVDAIPGDESAEGVIGLAGNVAEWTSSLAPHPDLPDVQVPSFRGGDFHLSQPVPMNGRPWLARDALYAQPFLGFRTASSTAP